MSKNALVWGVLVSFAAAAGLVHAANDYVEGVQDIVTAADFMDMTEGAQIVFI